MPCRTSFRNLPPGRALKTPCVNPWMAFAQPSLHVTSLLSDKAAALYPQTLDACLPELGKSAAAGRNPHVLNMSPPLSMKTRWFAPHTAYTMAKYGMSMCTLGMAAEYAQDGIAFNSLWPRTIIATAAVQNLLGGDEAMARSRKPEILADSAHAILVRDSHECTGNFFIDDEVLAEEGVTDLSDYGYGDGAELQTDIFLDA